MSEKLSQFDPDVLHARLVNLGETWSDANAAADLLEETKKSVLAEIARGMNFDSRIEREEAALASKAYKDHIDGMVDARRIANRARVNYEAAKMWIELARSVESTRRAELTLR